MCYLSVSVSPGKQFAVYLPLVMGPVMQMASAKPEWALLSDEDREVLNGDQEWELHNFGENQNFAVRTSGGSGGRD